MARILTVPVKPWGNSHGIRISREMMHILEIQPNDTLSMEIREKAIILRKAVSRKTLKEYADDYGGRLGPYEEFDWGEGIGIERWLDAEN